MHVSYFGLSCFKIVAKTAGRGSEDVTILLAPFDSKVGARPPQGKADIVIYPHTDPQFRGKDYTTGEPVTIHLPGEYAAKGVNIMGRDVPADPREGASRGNAVAYILDIEDMRIGYLGGLGAELSPDMYDFMTNIDILFLPVGDKDGVDGKTAEVVARKIEPKVIIPMHYADKKQLGSVKLKNLKETKDFCSNIGNCPKDLLDKYTVKAADIENAAMDVVMLKVH